MVGRRIKLYLEEHGIKQVFLSEKAQIPPMILSAMLAGQRKIEVMEYYRICQALGLDLMTFIVDGEAEV